MTSSKGFVSVILALMLFGHNGFAADLDIAARYGGTPYPPFPTIETQYSNSDPGSLFFVAVDLIGPTLNWGIRPAVSYERHWSEGGDAAHLQTASDFVCLGALRSVKVGHAVVSISLLTTRFADAYDVLDYYGDRANYEFKKWGMTVGSDLRFKFVGILDFEVGYRYHWREKSVFEPDGPLRELSYRVNGWVSQHCLFAGVVVSLGGE